MKHTVTGILAHVDAGKTTLSEAILYLTGTIRRLGRVDSRDAFLDNYQVERERGITVFSKQAGFVLGDQQVTLLDTPGHVDFSAEMERTLQVLDYAILVVSGADGVQGHTETLWRLLKRYRIPVFIFVNKMDQSGTDRGKRMQELKDSLDGNCIDFAERAEQPDRFYEELATCDEHTLELYLENGEVPEEQICRLVAERKVFPCYFGSALKLQGVEELMDGIRQYAPAKVYAQEFGAKVFKISRDEQGNRLTHLKVTGGILRPREILHGKEDEKINQIRVYNGAKYEPVPEAVPGMICTITGPLTTYPGQGIGTEKESEQPVLEPVLSYGVLLPPECDPQVMLKNLRQLEEEEPLLHIVWDENVQQIQAQVMGAVQIEILKGLIHDRFQVDVEFGAGRIVYKETVSAPVEGVGHFEPLRHYAEVHLWIEPAERGSGMQFETNCSEDVLSRNWQRLILTHLKEKIHRGTLTGAELTDVKITLIAGRAHQKHTEGGDFRQATYRAVRQGLREAGCRLLEPYYQFRLEVPTANIGKAMTDLERRNANFEAPETDGDLSVILGYGPVSTMWDYQTEVIAYTKGRGRMTCALKGYELCHNEEEVVLARGYDPDADLHNPTGSVFCTHGAGFVVPWDQVKDYMQVESPVTGAGGDGESRSLPAGSGFSPGSSLSPGGSAGVSGSRSAQAFGADDAELEAIFTRTYGERKNRLPADRGPRQVVYHPETGSRTAMVSDPVKSMGKPGYLKKDIGNHEEYLLVDGYNIIHAWEELHEVAQTTLEGARHKLMDILCNYQGYRKMTLILVFDAYKVSGNIGQAIKYHNIHVVYTKEAETADQYIEKLAHEMGRKYRVTVATSDGLEQLIIHGQGCLLMSAKELREDIERTSVQIEEDKEKLEKPGRNYMFSQVDQELAQYLEDVRLGKIKPEDET
jgi:small GTP-binding protein